MPMKQRLKCNIVSFHLEMQCLLNNHYIRRQKNQQIADFYFYRKNEDINAIKPTDNAYMPKYFKC